MDNFLTTKTTKNAFPFRSQEILFALTYLHTENSIFNVAGEISEDQTLHHDSWAVKYSFKC